MFGTGKSSWLLAGHFILASRVGFSTLVAEPGWVHPWLGSYRESPCPRSLGVPPRSPLRPGAAAPENFLGKLFWETLLNLCFTNLFLAELTG